MSSSGLEESLDAAQAALATGAWEEARAHFERALSVEETPEALEGLSWAAWWLDDADALFDLRERAYGAYKGARDPTGAARMATWLAIDHFDFRGALAVASGWLQRAHRLLDPLATGTEHGWLAMQEGYLARARGDLSAATVLARRAAEIGRRFEVADLEMLGLALEGSTLVGRAELDDGMRCLDEATALALEGEAEIPISSAWACCFMVSSCTAVRDYGRALEWCDRIAEFAARWGSRYMLAFCSAEYGAIHLWGGRWAEAEAVLEAAVESFDRARPAMTGGPLAGLAELRRRQGRRGEAEGLLRRAGPTPAAQLCRARLALDDGESRTAVELLERALRQVPEGSAKDRFPILELLVRARAAGGRVGEAEVAARELASIAGELGTEALLAARDLAAGVVAAARGEHEAARALLEDAADRLERCAAPFECADARLELAATLAAAGRTDDAAREASTALEALDRLGARSEAARARALIEAVSGAPAAGQGVTPREREVLALLAEGLTNRQIAERLVVSEHTVHRHVTNILRKLDLPSRSAAAAHAVRAGLLDAAPAEDR